VHNYTIQELVLRDENERVVANNTLCLIKTTYDVLYNNRTSFLHASELTKFNELEHLRRQKSFLQGRYAAKLALTKFNPHIKLNAICIANGVFGFPYIVEPNNLSCEISLSHSFEYAAAIAFSQAYPMAIDLEKISLAKITAIKSQMSSRELELVNQESEFTLLWTVKEALAKVLKCGLYINFNLLEIAQIKIENEHYQILFKNFPHYQALAWIIDGYVLSLVAPIMIKL
jgi:4'-phosphopantetheinyl transferase